MPVNWTKQKAAVFFLAPSAFGAIQQLYQIMNALSRHLFYLHFPPPNSNYVQIFAYGSILDVHYISLKAISRSIKPAA